VGLTLAMKTEKIRNLILDALVRERTCTARQLSYELSVYNIWLSPCKVASLMCHDDILIKSVKVDFVRRPRWSGLVYTHARYGDRPPEHRERSEEIYSHH